MMVTFISQIVELLQSARQATARTVNALITATYWEIGSQFYERTALSRNKAAMLRKAETTLSEDVVTPEHAHSGF